MKCENFVLAAEIPCEWKFATKFASDCECDGVVHSAWGFGPSRRVIHSTKLARPLPQSLSQTQCLFVRVRFGGVLSTVEEVVRVRFCRLLSRKTNMRSIGRTAPGHSPTPEVHSHHSSDSCDSGMGLEEFRAAMRHLIEAAEVLVSISSDIAVPHSAHDHPQSASLTTHTLKTFSGPTGPSQPDLPSGPDPLRTPPPRPDLDLIWTRKGRF